MNQTISNLLKNTGTRYRHLLLCGAVFALGLVGCATPSEKTSSLRVPRWQPHDFAFTAQAKVENPFSVRFAATVKGPDGRIFTLPGFYDGNNTWKLRVSANQEGDWSLVTESELPELNGKQAAFTCTTGKNPKIHGVLRVDEKNPHHFVFEDGTRFYMLAYECDWLWALDVGSPKLKAINPFLNKLASYGFNYVILDTYAHDTSWRTGKTGDDDYGPPPIFPWEGDNANPNHQKLNLAFWQHYDRVVHALYERGMMAHVLLKVYNKKVKWPVRESLEDDLFFRTIMARYAAYPNMIWDFSKEAHNEKLLDYKLNRLQFVRANDPYHHLLTVHDDDANNDAGAFDALTDFRVDQQHSKMREKILKQRQRRAWPVANVEFGYEQGIGGPEDKTYRIVQTPEDFVGRAWEVAMAGGYTAYYYTYTAWDVLRPEHTPKGYTYFKQLREFFEATRYWELAPAEKVTSEGWALANPGKEYVVCLKEARPFVLTVSAPNELKGEWFNPLTAQKISAGVIKSGSQEMRPPEGWTGLAVLHVR